MSEIAKNALCKLIIYSVRKKYMYKYLKSFMKWKMLTLTQLKLILKLSNCFKLF